MRGRGLLRMWGRWGRRSLREFLRFFPLLPSPFSLPFFLDFALFFFKSVGGMHESDVLRLCCFWDDSLQMIDHYVARGSHYVECQLLGEEGQEVPPFRIVGFFTT